MYFYFFILCDKHNCNLISYKGDNTEYCDLIYLKLLLHQFIRIDSSNEFSIFVEFVRFIKYCRIYNAVYVYRIYMIVLE